MKWNKWHAYEDENGNTEWAPVEYDTFERWAADGMRHTKIPDVEAAANEFVESMAYLARGEQRHIPHTRDEFTDLAIRFVERWNSEVSSEKRRGTKC